VPNISPIFWWACSIFPASNREFFRLSRAPINFVEFLDQIVDMVRLEATLKASRFNYERHSPLLHLCHGGRQSGCAKSCSSSIRTPSIHADRSANLNVRYSSEVATFEVTDTGIAFRKEDIVASSNPSARPHAGDAVHSGTGLGLTIAHL